MSPVTCRLPEHVWRLFVCWSRNGWVPGSCSGWREIGLSLGIIPHLTPSRSGLRGNPGKDDLLYLRLLACLCCSQACSRLCFWCMFNGGWKASRDTAAGWAPPPLLQWVWRRQWCSTHMQREPAVRDGGEKGDSPWTLCVSVTYMHIHHRARCWADSDYMSATGMWVCGPPVCVWGGGSEYHGCSMQTSKCVWPPAFPVCLFGAELSPCPCDFISPAIFIPHFLSLSMQQWYTGCVPPYTHTHGNSCSKHSLVQSGAAWLQKGFNA